MIAIQWLDDDGVSDAFDDAFEVFFIIGSITFWNRHVKLLQVLGFFNQAISHQYSR